MAEGGRSDGTAGEPGAAEVVEQWQERAWGRCDLSAVADLIAEPFVRHNRDGTKQRTRDEDGRIAEVWTLHAADVAWEA